MAQAAVDDFGPSPPFDYAVAGHDVDTGGLDPSAKTTCCQCYQLVYVLPENEARANGNGASAIAIPRPADRAGVQYRGRRREELRHLHGRGRLRRHSTPATPVSRSRAPVRPVPLHVVPRAAGRQRRRRNAAIAARVPQERQNLVTAPRWARRLPRPSAIRLQSVRVVDADPAGAERFDPLVPRVERSRRTIAISNWQVYAKQIECPTHLTQVTGCKLAPQGLPAANPNVDHRRPRPARRELRRSYTTDDDAGLLQADLRLAGLR